jgi:diguanylate cyclase (GGDEF)-like protein
MQKRKAFFTSISKKLMLLYIIGAFSLAVTLVAVAIALSSKILTEGASAQMNLFCEERADDINLEMVRIEDAVSSLARWTRSRIPDVETIKEDAELRDAIVDDADDLIRFMTEQNDFIESAYIHYTLDVTGITDREEGVYYTRDDDGNFKTIPFTQEEIVNDPVAEDWYYGPIRLGEPAWTKPYYDYSVENYIVSYIEPVFIGDTPVAVIGIDISFTRVIDWVDTFSYQESGYMFLKEADGTVHYHYDDLVNGDTHGDERDWVQENGDLMDKPATGKELVRYDFEDRERAMAFVTLRNGMKLVLCDDYANIYRERDNAVVLMIILSVLITTLIAIVAVVMVNRITDPLRKITEAARAVSEDNFDVDLPPENDDEIGELSKMTRLAIENARARAEKAASKVREQERQIEKSAKVLKQQGDDLIAMKNLAYVDSLTNVKNKLAYDDTVEYINEKIRNGTAEFAVIMCDLNYLKHINDNLGHIAGDEAIQKTASILCKAFPLSTVFRIGGDEFAVLPTGLDYARIDEKLDALKTMIESQRNISDNYLERISLAFGCAVFERGKDTTYQEVFERADKIMYEEKKKIHARDGISTDR